MTYENIKKEFLTEYVGQSPHWSLKKYRSYTKGMSKEDEYVFRCGIVKEILKNPLRSWDIQLFTDLGFNKFGEPTVSFSLDHKGLVLLKLLQKEYFKKPHTINLTHYILTGDTVKGDKLMFIKGVRPKLFIVDLTDVLKYLKEYDNTNIIHRRTLSLRLYNSISHNWSLKTINYYISKLKM